MGSEILANMEALAAQGLRVLALASKEWHDATNPREKNEQAPREDVEKELIFQGLVGLYDPLRPESKGAVQECHEAGIVVHMLTGDHPGTARAIALQVGILPADMQSLAKRVTDSMVMTASQFDKLSDDDIDNLPVLPGYCQMLAKHEGTHDRRSAPQGLLRSHDWRWGKRLAIIEACRRGHCHGTGWIRCSQGRIRHCPDRR